MHRSISQISIGFPDMDGPNRPLIGRSHAAPQLLQTGHSCNLQNFHGLIVGLRTSLPFPIRN
ncbi:hypothetical protein BV911_18600 [Pseudoruegeria sp. SK021]|nr:hypothetical protein BV911_18600 [Pseudoruegeria sp. SK021]